MIFNKTELRKALMEYGSRYNKIIFVELDKDLYTPIKMTDAESETTYPGQSYSELLQNFAETWLEPSQKNTFLDVMNLISLKSSDIFSLEYDVNFDGHYKHCILEFIPVDNNKGYIFAKDALPENYGELLNAKNYIVSEMNIKMPDNTIFSDISTYVNKHNIPCDITITNDDAKVRMMLVKECNSTNYILDKYSQYLHLS